MLRLSSAVIDPALADAIQGLLKELSCPICLTLLTNPQQTPCGHIFCESCILRALRPRTNDDSQDLHNRPHDPCCPLCKHKCNKRCLQAAPVLVQRSVERMRDVLFAFQQATGGVTCSQYQPVEVGKLESIPEEMEQTLVIPSSPGDLFRSLECLKQCEESRKINEFEEFETQLLANLIPETQLLSEKFTPNSTTSTTNGDVRENIDQKDERDEASTNEIAGMENAAPETQFVEGLTSSPVAIKPPSSTTPIVGRSCKKTETVKTPKSTDFKNQSKKRAAAKEEEEVISTPTERNKKKKTVGRPLSNLSTTMLSKEQSAQISLFCDIFNIRFDTTFNPSTTTHLIVATRERNGLLLAKRSYKYLQARLSPESVLTVSIDWIDECLKGNRIISMEEYVVDGDEETSAVAAPTSIGIFTGMQFYFYGNAYNIPSLTDLLSLSLLGKAAVIEKVEQLKHSGIIVFASPSEDRFEKDAGVIMHYKPIISSAWILDCISLGRLLNKNDYHIL